MYTKVFLSFEKFLMFESRVLKLCCVFVLKNSKDCLKWSKQLEAIYLLKCLSYAFSIPLILLTYHSFGK